jgi:hypothetical protein
MTALRSFPSTWWADSLARWVSAAAVVMAINLPASAGAVERWTASSTASLSITGNVTFSPQKISFFNGKALPLSRVAPAEQVAAFTDDEKPVSAVIYRVTKPAHLKLKNGNRLCGSARKPRAVTFVAVWTPEALPGDKEPRALAVFSGDQIPASSLGSGSCGVYFYLAR